MVVTTAMSISMPPPIIATLLIRVNKIPLQKLGLYIVIKKVFFWRGSMFLAAGFHLCVPKGLAAVGHSWLLSHQVPAPLGWVWRGLCVPLLREPGAR